MSVCSTCGLMNARDIACVIVYLLIGNNYGNPVRIYFNFNYAIYCVKFSICFIVKVVSVAVMKKTIKAVKYIGLFCFRSFGVLLMLFGIFGAFGISDDSNNQDIDASDPQVEEASVQN